ncbi:MAG: hypothetical protein GWM98_05215, partial [Nitrospinaceae bacterium]|nr:hypothetical protein [Nitrospinaceae bacterium]NIR53963.1 hypothetical protein [Nitrospinaceae bacterium]NIS84381.1 hypothetical protein [Nitrospinaceae bacterium]NIT81183.1 hypothetical protein [Nitrospinaceae bacterium]NIU43466.1 hypothetical protein [Nitrospinaceae bacterium]
KNLQLLVEYFEKKNQEFDERKHWFDKINTQLPDTLKQFDSFEQRVK